MGLTPVAGGDTLALTASGKIVSFKRSAPATPVGNVEVRGLAAGERLLGSDHRAADRRRHAISNTACLHTIDPTTGVATFKTALTAGSTDTTSPFAGLAGSRDGVNFNPAAGRLRAVSDTGQNLRINVDTGATLRDGNLNPPAGISGKASARRCVGRYRSAAADNAARRCHRT